MTTAQHLTVSVPIPTVRTTCLWALVLAFGAAAVQPAAVAPSTITEEEKYRDGAEFNNNLISDLSPLLALFGERFAQQFMSFSTSWVDSLIFSMAPLGVITAIVGAIRVGGPPWLRGLIGRARETRAAAEVELMSSTSHEVCEIWNGDAIVRVMGSPRIQQFLFFEDVPTELSKKIQERRAAEAARCSSPEKGSAGTKGLRDFELNAEIARKFHVLTLDEAEELGLVQAKTQTGRDCRKRVIDWLGEFCGGCREDPPENTTSPTNPRKSPKEDAPNISMNLSVLTKPWELYMAAVAGVFLQLGVITVATYTAYTPQLQFNKAGLTVANYSYPMTCAGTLLLVAGMFIAASVVEKSTREVAYQKIPELAKTRVFVFWIQRSCKLNDQTFDSYAIFSGPVNVVRTSRRRLPHGVSTSNVSRLMCGFTVLGTVISALGFIFQFIGLRGMHWSASTAQLAATILMTILRAFLRRRVASRPYSVKLSSEFELEWLAAELARHKGHFGSYFSGGKSQSLEYHNDQLCRLFAVATGGMPGDQLKNTNGIQKSSEAPAAPTMRQPASSPEPPSAQWNRPIPPKTATTVQICPVTTREPILGAKELVSMRQRVGLLSRWRGPASETAVAAANAIEVVMNTLFPPQTTLLKELSWPLDVQVGCCCYKDVKGTDSDAPNPPLTHPKDEQIILQVEVVKVDRKEFWQADVEQIDALLSLWLCHAHGPEEAIRKTERHGDKAETKWLRNKPRKLSMLFLGPDNRLLRRDLRWWVPGGAAGLLEVRASSSEPVAMHDAQPNVYSIASHRIIGFQSPGEAGHTRTITDGYGRGANTITFECRAVSLDDLGSTVVPDKPDDQDAQHPDADRDTQIANNQGKFPGASGPASLGVVTTTPKELLFAQHIFTAFMVAATKKLDRIGGKSEASHETALNIPLAWQHFRLKNSVVAKLALGVQNAGLARSLEEAYISIIPPLSLQNKLPVDAAVDLVLHDLEPYEDAQNWEKSTAIYLELLNAANQFGSACPFALKAAVATVEYLRRLVNTKELYPKEHPEFKGQVESVRRALKEEVSPQIKASMRSLWNCQGRGDEYHKLLDTTGEAGAKEAPMAPSVGFSELHKKICAGGEWKPEEFKRYVNEQDVLGWSPLHYAVVRNNDFLKWLIDQGADVNLQDIAGWSPLHYAALKGNTSALLLARTARVEARARDGTHPLHYAARYGVDFAKELLKQKASVDVKDTTKRTPLHWAALAKNGAAVKLLVDDHASVSAQDLQEMTPLHLAATTGDCTCIKLLIVRADLEAKEESQRTPVMLAALNGHEDAAELLLEKGADRMAKDTDGRTALHLVALKGNTKLAKILLEEDKSKGLINHVDNRKQTAFHVAISSGHEDMAKLLLERGADLNAVDGESQSALHLAALEGNTKVANFLLEEDKSKHLVNHVDNRKQTAFHLAISSGRDNMVTLLLERGADLNAVDDESQTALHLAAVKGNIKVAEILLEKDKSKGLINHVDNRRQTAFHLAISSGHEDMVKLLLECGADLNTVDSESQSALHVACSFGHVSIARLLIVKGDGSIDAKNEVGQTAVHVAVLQENEELLRLLLEHHADPGAMDGDGYTPLLLVVRRASNDVALAKILLEYPAKLDAQDKEGYTALHHAIGLGIELLAKLLISNKADVNIKSTKRKETPLHVAIKAKLPNVVDLLLAADADKNAQTAKGRTALHLAAKRNYVGILRALLAAGADRTTGDIRGNSPLHLACLSCESDCEVIAALFGGHGSLPGSRNENGAAQSATTVTARLLCQQNNDGASPLLLACTVGKESYVKFLLEKGADPNSRDHRGTMPLFAALDAWDGSTNNAGILDLLLQHRAVVTKDEHGWTVEQIAQSKGNWEGLRDLIRKHPSSMGGSHTMPLAMPSEPLFSPTSWLQHPEARLENNGLDFIYDISTPTNTLWHEDKALIGANHPFPPQSASACEESSQEYELFNPKTYFEVRVVNTDDQIIGLGLCDKLLMGSYGMPGWNSNTWGYHGDDGKLFMGQGFGFSYSETYGVEDVVGCGVDREQNLFFTKNGVHLGIAHRKLTSRLFPMVGVSPRGHISANFGAQPFRYAPQAPRLEAAELLSSVEPLSLADTATRTAEDSQYDTSE